MKNLFIVSTAIAVIAFAACNSGNNPSTDNSNSTADTSQSTMPAASNETSGQASNTQTNNAASIKEIVTGYLQLKNALANDDSKEAANGGKAVVAAMQKFDKSSLTAEQKKDYEDMESAMKENAEHIGENAGKIDHQREHFDMLSQDLYDMVKEYGAGQSLYKDFCPMYNDNKGAFWLSETKEIKNPYLGKKMPTCGEVKEEMK
ncbi:DUF3347 domain-containing protein [Ilyomonas limi]|uniref:DUF3347 domain-containing protein n=1 Tax=Ilyomonas limi TaxID=2575867 RepID=A0A4U3KUZ6_9BACT|nr:DUF3347 domain-containing protein [Ilyomonas limi]TKK66288.1 DUF3347 domain-containing protein [Ilyomonas limi]